MNLEEIKLALNDTRARIAAQDYGYDYLGEAQSILHEEGEFWFYYSQALRSLPESQQMDLRANGAIAAAVYAARRCYEYSPDMPATIGERVLSLEMMTHGMSAVMNSGMAQLGQSVRSRFLESLAEWRAAMELARAKFPEDPWFREMEENLEDNFGKAK